MHNGGDASMRRELEGPNAWWLALLALLLLAAGALAPLADIDFPIHLALGEWIVRHRAVPWTEPFAWTRAGAAYYDYSWGADALYYATWHAFGPIGLRIVAGVQLVASAAAIVWLGRVARWSSWTIFLLAWAQVWIVTAMSDYLRPATLLFALVPAAWALAIHIGRDTSPWRAAVGLYLVAASAANTHAFFFLTALPLVGFVAQAPDAAPPTPSSRGRFAICACALVLGWLSTPYGLAWPAIFRLNAAHNVVLAFPSSIVELRPGFLGLSPRDRARLAGVALALLPWAIARERIPVRARVVYAVLWLVGLIAFAVMVRSLLVWWLMMIPLVAIVAERATSRVTPLIARALPFVVVAWVVVLGARYWIDARDAWPAAAGPGSSARTLPSPAALLIEPSLEWLDRNAPHPIHGRLLTVFSFGSYVAWRMPGLSESVDGRTIFPDSAAAPDAFWRSTSGPIPLGPWQSADVAIVPVTFPVASVLDTARGWQRVDVRSRARGAGAWMPGLWVRRAWLAGVTHR